MSQELALDPLLQTLPEDQVNSGRGCRVECLMNILRIYREARADSTILRDVSRGDQLNADCFHTPGGRYNECGGGNQWVGVDYQDPTGIIKGYVAAKCVTYVPM
jgi:hypothetical protein